LQNVSLRACDATEADRALADVRDLHPALS